MRTSVTARNEGNIVGRALAQEAGNCGLDLVRSVSQLSNLGQVTNSSAKSESQRQSPSLC